ncbi:MAG: VOC family protein [Sulfobacillus sp.]
MSAILFRVILPVSDIELASTFYAYIFGQPGSRVSSGRHYFQCGETILACYDPVADKDAEGDGWRFHENQYLYFAIENLESMSEKIQQAGGKVTSSIKSMPWGERMFYALDPFGNPISFVDKTTVFRG